MTFTERDIKESRDAFERFDRDRSGTLDLWELRAALQDLGKEPTEDELSMLISAVDDEHDGEVDFEAFLGLIDHLKKRYSVDREDVETVSAFVAMGGNPDKTGEINTEKLKSVVKDYKLKINIEELLADIDSDGSGYIDYEEFKALMGSD